MTLKHFIERPVLASVISIVIVIAGLIGLATLPVEQYPDIAPPTVMVRASYPGASAETIQKSVIVPLEQAINGVEDMTYMTSSAAVGSASVTIREPTPTWRPSTCRTKCHAPPASFLPRSRRSV